MRVRVLLAAAGILLCLRAPLFAQEGSESLEKEARKACNAGDFGKCALKFEGAAKAASDPQRRSQMLVWAASAHFNGGKISKARDALRDAFTGSPDLTIEPGFFPPEFVTLAGEVRAAVHPAPPPPEVDLPEMNRVAGEKLKDGKFEDVIHDYIYNVPRDKLCADAEALGLLGQAYKMQGNLKEAENVCARARPGVPSTPPPSPTPAPAAENPLALCRKALVDRDAQNALSCAYRLLATNPQSSDAHLLLGKAYVLAGDKGRAETELKDSLVFNPKNEEALLALYELYSKDKNWDAALPALQHAIEVNPENGATLLALGRKAREDRDLGLARKAFATAVATFPKDVFVLTEYAGILLEAGDVDAALRVLNTAANLNPDKVIVRTNYAKILRKKGLWTDAAKEYGEAIHVDADYAPAQRGLGTLLLEREQFAEAIEPLRKAVLRDATNLEGAWALARAQRKAGALKDAAESLEQSAALDKALLDDEAGAVAYERGRYEEAVGFFEKALAKEPNSAVYKANRDKAAAAAAFLKGSGLTASSAR
jgi:tetratricopeptide (TPR) repeat protein